MPDSVDADVLDGGDSGHAICDPHELASWDSQRCGSPISDERTHLARRPAEAAKQWMRYHAT